MLDLQFICENVDDVETNCRNRGVSVDVRRVVQLADDRRKLIAQTDQMRHEQKEVSAKIPKASPEEKAAFIARGKELREGIGTKEAELKEVEDALRDVQARIPNMSHPEAPVGGEDALVVLRQVGQVPKFDFQPKDHVELMTAHKLFDLEGGAKVAGHGFYFLRNEAVMLELALVQYAVETLRRAGFDLYTTPDLARDEVLEGTGYLPRGPEGQIYSIQNTDLSLVATAEITLGGLLKDEILEDKQLPIKMGGISHCFRTEAGAHGKATRGIYRVHQFTKVEMFAFTAPDLAASGKMHDVIVGVEEQIFQGLQIPYRVIDTPTGDLGGPAYRKFDLEAWMPGRNEFGEVTSASNCTDFQSRRLGIRCKSTDWKGTRFVHTLNGTAVAITRAMIALIENHQQSDGSIVIPEALQKWTGFDRIG
jgi:seryl-tRNA synthetase